MSKVPSPLLLGLVVVLFFANTTSVSANVVYSQLDDSVELVGNNFSGSGSTFTDATGQVSEVRISYNDKGNGLGHFIGVGITNADTGTTYYGYNPVVSSICGNTFESAGLNTKQILTFGSAWEWRAYPCDGPNLTFNPNHRYYLVSFRNTGGVNTQSYYGSSTDLNSFYGYVENTTSFHDSQKSITALNFPSLADGSIDEINRTISLHVPFGTDISAITPTISISDGASVSPSIGTPQDFNNFVVYTVTAIDGSSRGYKIKVLFDCLSGCVSTTLYSQPDNSTEISHPSVSSFPLFTGASGNISKLKFSYNDHGETTGHFIGLSVADLTTGTNYYSSSGGQCGDAYESKGTNSKVVVTLDSSTQYREFPCTGPNLVLDPTHTYGVNLFRNHGGVGNQRFYGSSSANDSVYLHIESHNATTSCIVGCLSSVIFLPGLEASRLYKPGVTPFSEDRLWFPNNQNDVRELALSPETGESVNQNIYTRDVIDEVAGVNIYKSFLDYMDGLVEGGDIPYFEAFPYDWRMSVEDVATSPVHLEGGGSYSVVARLEEIANASPTGRVTLITHSNGGLVAKELVEELERLGKANMVERIIMVAAPELGTPKAILEMLHGADFFMGFPNGEVTRELGENMKSAYTLLPSREYFARLGVPLIQPIIEFSTSTPVTEYFRNVYGNSISDYDNLRKFILGENGLRAEPAASDVNTPNVLKNHFIQGAEANHELRDAWTPPSGIDVVQIIGWGLDTLRGVEYGSAKKKVCNIDLSVCNKIDFIDPQPLVTSEGDRSVVSLSAEALRGERYWVKIFEYNKDTFFLPGFNGRDHKNILEIEPLQTLILTLLKHEATSTLPDFIFSTKPTELVDEKRLRIGVHSPVTLHLYDDFGRHTGPIPNPDPSSDFDLYEEQIPNTYYWRIGEGQYVGSDGSATTTIFLTGEGVGAFTLDIEEVVGGETATTTIYEDIPVTASTTATLAIGPGASALTISLDIDGNRIIDVSLGGNDGVTIEQLFSLLKSAINIAGLKKGDKTNLLEKVRNVEKKLGSKEDEDDDEDESEEKPREMSEDFDKIVKEIRRLENKKRISHGKANELINIVENLRDRVVK